MGTAPHLTKHDETNAPAAAPPRAASEASAINTPMVNGAESRAAQASPEFLACFLEKAGATERALRFDEFMRLALYDSQVGYYTRHRQRVGRGAQSDFITATSVGEARGSSAASAPGNGVAAGANLFGELVVQSCLALAGAEFCAAATFVEIGAEPSGGVLRGLAHPFAAARTIGVGQPIELGEGTNDSGALAGGAASAMSSTAAAGAGTGEHAAPLIVFSNELFDAQPCRRFVWSEPGWREIWVQCAGDGELVEIERTPEEPPDALPRCATAGYRIDAPVAASELARQIAAARWRGLFLAFDYGKTWQEICEATPQGSARAYHQHRQSNELLARPGEQDLTCHVCWDWLQSALAESGFEHIALDSQEGFFVRHAGAFIAQAIAADARQLSPRKQALLQLLHPGNMGQKFQALSALRS